MLIKKRHKAKIFDKKHIILTFELLQKENSPFDSNTIFKFSCYIKKSIIL